MDSVVDAFGIGVEENNDDDDENAKANPLKDIASTLFDIKNRFPAIDE